MRAADWAWLTLGCGVLAYERSAPPGELMSEGVDRYITSHPWITSGVIVITALHLLNRLPGFCDPYRIISDRLRRAAP
jgi:hypothetical protein